MKSRTQVRHITLITAGQILNYDVVEVKKKQYELHVGGSRYALAGIEFAPQVAQQIAGAQRIGAAATQIAPWAARTVAQPVQQSTPVPWRKASTRGALLFAKDGTLDQIVETGAEDYLRKYLVKPTAARVNPLLLPEGTTTVGGISVTASASVLPGRIWIGGGA